MPVDALLLDRFGGKTPVHFTGSFTESTCGRRVLDKDSVPRNLYADVSIDVYLSWARKITKAIK